MINLVYKTFIHFFSEYLRFTKNAERSSSDKSGLSIHVTGSLTYKCVCSGVTGDPHVQTTRIHSPNHTHTHPIEITHLWTSAFHTQYYCMGMCFMLFPFLCEHADCKHVLLDHCTDVLTQTCCWQLSKVELIHIRATVEFRTDVRTSNQICPLPLGKKRP